MITTIMMNFIVLRIITWAIGANGPLRKPSSVVPETRSLLKSARLPILIPDTNLHLGIVIALVLAVAVYFFLFRTVWGVEIRTVGKNLNAAKYVGINVNRNIVFTMALSGGLAGLAGAIQVMGIPPLISQPDSMLGTGLTVWQWLYWEVFIRLVLFFRLFCLERWMPDHA